MHRNILFITILLFSGILVMALNLPLDEKLAQSINRRRIAEEQRKHRIFNAKERIMGVCILKFSFTLSQSLVILL